MRGILTVILSVIFVPIFLVMIVLFSVKVTIFNPDFIKSSLVKSGVYDKSPEIISQIVVNQFNESQEEKIDEKIQKQLIDVFTKTLTVDWIKTNTEDLIDEIYDYSLGNDNSTDVMLNFIEIKASFKTNLIDSFMEKYLALKICDSKQMKETANLQSFDDIECLPEGTDIEKLSNNSGKLADELFEDVPDSINIGRSLMNNEKFSYGVRLYESYFRVGLWAICGLFILLISLIMFFSWSNISFMLKSIGISIFIASAIFLLALYAGNILVTNAMVQSSNSILPVDINNTIVDVVKEFVRIIIGRMNLFGYISLAVSITLVVWSFFIYSILSRDPSLRIKPIK